MNKQSLKMPVYYMLQLQQYVESRHVDTHAWLARSGLSEEMLTDPDATFAYAQYESLITSAVEICGEPALGLYVGQRLGVTTHGMMGYAIMSSNTIREALELFARFLVTRAPLVKGRLVESGTSLQVQIIERFAIDRVQIGFLEALLVTLRNILVQISHDAVCIRRVCLPYAAPAYRDLYPQILGCAVEFNAEHALMEVALDGVDDRLLLADPTSLQQARLLCEKELEKLRGADSLAFRTRRVLLESAGNFPSLPEVARQFHMSSRTLHRKLQREGTSFKEILEDVSGKLAVEYLTRSELSIQETGFLLGYVDIANFRRAFKRWHGVAPSEFRRRHSFH